MSRGARFLSLDGVERPGIRQIVVVKDASAGSEWNIGIPGGQQWRILTLRATLTTDATVGARSPKIAIENQDGLTLWRSGDAYSIAAGQSTTLFGAVGSGAVVNNATGQNSNFILPPLWLPPGWSVGSVLSIVSGGDTWTGIRLWVEQLYTTDAALSD